MSGTEKRSISLPADQAAYLDGLVASGAYASASEVVRAGLRLLENQEAKLAALRNALKEGWDSGKPEAFDVEAFLAEANGDYDAKS